ncbi:MAG: segregation/condensation protein A [Proteobacteria bacterium]|nr:segregation/condensation protein A [Pseudomonadota bacterium]
MSISVKLETFEGPLDLLLHLIKKEKVDIYDIPIVKITQQYLDYLDKMKELNIYIASEFLLMAATLIYIKSKMLLPKKVEIDSEIGEIQKEEDPRAPLVEKLVEYQRIKEMVEILEKKDRLFESFFPRGYTEFKFDYYEEEFDPYVLVKAFYDLVKKLPDESYLTIELENLSIVDKMNEIMELLKNEKKMTFFSYTSRIKKRLELIVFFLSLLELARLRMVYLRQLREFNDIEILLRVEENGDGE